MSEIEFAPDLPSVVHLALPAEEFAAVEVVIEEPLIGGSETRLLPAAATAVFYGEGGSGKTTLMIDLAFHLAAGVDWLGFEINAPVRVMILENEGPIDEFRLKLRRKLATWDGGSLDGRLLIHEAPWGRVDLRNDAAVDGLAGQLAEHEIDVLIAGPIRRLGLEGGGTPAETVAFMQLLDRVRDGSKRQVALANVHHQNKGGDISGAFEAEFDTVIQVRPGESRDRTEVFFRKSRWSSRIHRSTLTLGWVVASEGFAVIESDLDQAGRDAARDADETAALEWLSAYVTKSPGVARGKAETAYHEAHGNRGRNLARRVIDRQLQHGQQAMDACKDYLAAKPENQAADGQDRREQILLAAGPGEKTHGTYLYPSNHALSPLAAPPNGENGEILPTPDSKPLLATQPPPLERGAAGEMGGEGNQQGDDDTEIATRLGDPEHAGHPE